MRIRPSLLIIVLGLIAYSNSFSGSFIFDDKYAILENPSIRHLSLPKISPTDIRPVVTFSLALNYALGGLNVRGYHAFNLLTHLLAAMVLFGIIRRTLELASLRNPFGPAAAGLATAVSLLWAVHPLHTQSVNYIIQRAELLMGLFYLLTIYCFIRSAEGIHPGRWSLASIVSCALGTGSKSVMITAPLLILFYDRIFLASSFREIFKRRGILYAGLAATWGIQGILLLNLIHSPYRSIGFHLPTASWIEYLQTQPGVILHYLKLSFWPNPLIFDIHWPVARNLPAVLLPGIPIVGLLLGILWANRRKWRASFLGLWFFLILAPTSSFIPVADIAVEHRMYLPLAAIVALVVLGGYRMGLRGRIAVCLVTACSLTLVSLTLLRNEDYRSEVLIWGDSLKKNPGNARAHNNLGIALTTQGKMQEAIAHFSEAFRLEPRYADAYYNSGVAYTRLKNYGKAISLYAKAIELRPNYPEAYDGWGHALANQGNLEQAIILYIQALRLKPDFILAHEHLDKTITLLTKELERNPNDFQAHNSLGVALAGQGKLEEAALHFTEALRIKPDSAQVHNNWGAALADRGRMEEAISHFTEALRLDPNDTDAPDNLQLARESLGKK